MPTDRTHTLVISSHQSKVEKSRYVHYSPTELQPGDTVVPWSQLTPEQIAARPEGWQKNDSEHLPTYDPNLVYMYDQRHLDEDYDLPVDFYDWHGYEVEPLGPVQRDPEAVDHLRRYEQRHGHPWQGWDPVPGCAECEVDHGDGHDPEAVPEWYHQYAWATPKARVVRQVYSPEGGYQHGYTH